MKGISDTARDLWMDMKRGSTTILTMGVALTLQNNIDTCNTSWDMMQE